MASHLQRWLSLSANDDAAGAPPLLRALFRKNRSCDGLKQPKKPARYCQVE